MKREYWLIAFALIAAMPDRLLAQSLWDRRDPKFAYLFQDYRARQVGDVLTIAVNENTGADAQETRDMAKQTAAGYSGSGKGSTSSLGQVLRSFATDLDLQAASNRSFGGKANTLITRNFTDQLTVVVVGVYPNGNLIIEGYRQRMITREMRTLRVVGVVRPADIGPFNTIQSQFVGNLQISYMGRGPESSFMNQGWGGRIFNKIWPF